MDNTVHDSENDDPSPTTDRTGPGHGESSGVTTVGPPTGEQFGHLPVRAATGNRRVPEVPADAYHHRELACGHTDVELVTYALGHGMNVVLKGPPGAGKSLLARYLAARTNRPLYRVTLSETTYREDLLGQMHLVSGPDGESVTEWVDGPLTRAAREGGLLLLDEINAADANTAAALNAVMEQRGTRSLALPKVGETVTPHDAFRVVATANPGYQGTYELNDAFEDRFRHVELDYLPPSVEVEVVFDRTGLDRRREPEVERLVEFAGRLREAFLDGELSTPITTREVVRIATFIEDGFLELPAAVRSELLARVHAHDESLVETLIEKQL